MQRAVKMVQRIINKPVEISHCYRSDTQCVWFRLIWRRLNFHNLTNVFVFNKTNGARSQSSGVLTAKNQVAEVTSVVVVDNRNVRSEFLERNILTKCCDTNRSQKKLVFRSESQTTTENMHLKYYFQTTAVVSLTSSWKPKCELIPTYWYAVLRFYALQKTCC